MKRKKYLLLSAVMAIGCLIVSNTAMATTSRVVLVSSYSTRIRSDANAFSSSLYTVYVGQPLLSRDTVKGSDGGSWEKVSYDVNGNTKTGYVASNAVRAYSYDSSFDSSISSFPDTYKQSLRYLHALYPKWKFKAMKTGLSFSTAVASFQKSALIDTSDSAMIASSTILEGTTWRRASLRATAYFVDPRTQLSASSATQFVSQSYDSNETEGDAKQMLASTFMSGTESISKETWAHLFSSAASSYKISIIHLVSRAMQEQGSAGGLGAKGKTINGTTYYNIFNIGATTGADAGMTYASKQGWDTIEKSINGGASYLAKNYIAKGQYSIYLERFNVAPDAYYSTYTHGYMTNLRAASSEARKMIDGYIDAGLANQSFTLSIPIYENMPDYTSYPGTSATQFSLPNADSITTLASTSGIIADQNYTSDAIKPSFSLSSDSKTLEEGIDYAVTGYSGNTNPGTAKITVCGLGRFMGTKTLSFNIVSAPISSSSITSSKSAYAYNGKVIKPELKVTFAGITLLDGAHYNITSNSKSPGRATAVVNGIGYFIGSKTATFIIVPAKGNIKSLQSRKRGIKMIASKKTGASGYQISYKYTGSSKWTSKSSSKTTFSLSKLKSRKYVYVKTRAYKTISGKEYYGSWSSQKKVRIR